MMALYAVTGCLLVAVFGLLWVIRVDTLKQGEIKEKHEAMKGMLDDNMRVKKARNAMASDPDGDVAKRVRSKYTRKP